MSENLGEIAEQTKSKKTAKEYEMRKMEEDLVRELKIQEDPDYKEFQRCKNETINKENKEKEKKAYNNVVVIIGLIAVWAIFIAILCWVIK